MLSLGVCCFTLVFGSVANIAHSPSLWFCSPYRAFLKSLYLLHLVLISLEVGFYRRDFPPFKHITNLIILFNLRRPKSRNIVITGR